MRSTYDEDVTGPFRHTHCTVMFVGDYIDRNASDVTVAPQVIAAIPGRLRKLVADRGYDADPLRAD